MATQLMRHMMPRDIPLFCTYYLTPEGQAYQQWEFDVLVGDPEEPGAFYPNSARRQALYLNALKIDAIGWFFSTPTIIEVKPNGSCGAIGQLLVYQKWYYLNYGTHASTMLVCKRISKQLLDMCISMNITVRVVDSAADYVVHSVEREIQSKISKLSVLPMMSAVA